MDPLTKKQQLQSLVNAVQGNPDLTHPGQGPAEAAPGGAMGPGVVNSYALSAPEQLPAEALAENQQENNLQNPGVQAKMNATNDAVRRFNEQMKARILEQMKAKQGM